MTVARRRRWIRDLSRRVLEMLLARERSTDHMRKAQGAGVMYVSLALK